MASRDRQGKASGGGRPAGARAPRLEAETAGGRARSLSWMRPPPGGAPEEDIPRRPVGTDCANWTLRERELADAASSLLSPQWLSKQRRRPALASFFRAVDAAASTPLGPLLSPRVRRSRPRAPDRRCGRPAVPSRHGQASPFLQPEPSVFARARRYSTGSCGPTAAPGPPRNPCPERVSIGSCGPSTARTTLRVEAREGT